MLYFNNDYNEICHPAVLEAMLALASVQMPGYGMDVCCKEADELIKKACSADNAAVHFLVGGTQTNLTVIAAALRPHQGVIAADTGHINVHETGAIEATGHKVITVASKDGKVCPQLAREIVVSQRLSADAEHIAQPKMIYISNPTEYGTLYSLAELKELSALCREMGLYLFVDGARMGYALCAPGNDLFMEDYAALCDVFYIGGTKCGMLMGEAVVICNPALQKDFRYLIKQKGGMLAKGRLLGVQFEEMFKDGLYEEACGHGIKMALKLKQGLVEKGYEFLFDSNSNQQFPILTEEKRAQLAEKYEFAFWERVDENRVGVRFCTSWATKESAIDALLADL